MEVRPADLELAVKILMTSVEAIAGKLAADPSVDAEALAEETTLLVERYLLA